jgi:ATP-dependent RNA helicase DOB1
MDLFSFLNEDPKDDDHFEQDESPNVPLKRKATTEQQNLDNNNAEPPKKPRIEPAPQPILLDEFETEAKREVAGSAGLTGAPEEAGSRLELRHQVSLFYAMAC